MTDRDRDRERERETDRQTDRERHTERDVWLMLSFGSCNQKWLGPRPVRLD